MSPENVFAAQMWSWPDAIIKRDAQGAVLFVNAAFLGLYGGTVENWTGMAVTGWNAPPAPGQAVRFETRVNGPEGERVFDWLESTGADGGALAVARDVTAILPPPPNGGQPLPDMLPAVEELTVQSQLAANPDSAFETVAAQPTVAAQAPLAAHAPVAALAPIAAHAPVADSAPAQPLTPVADAPPPVVPPLAPPVEPQASEAAPLSTAPAIEDLGHISPLDATAGEASGAPAVEAAPEPVAEPATVADPAPVTEDSAAATEAGREYERRTLPVEDENAVLGNNWRDAVIAKAVGAEGATPEPIAEAEEVSEPRPPAGATSSEGIRILLAEDNAINALLTRTLLEAEGCHVDTVEDGALAVEAMRVNTYDLIFMDMRMPNMDGLDATRAIRKLDHRSKGLPIIALTANAFDDDRNACFDAGMNDFMTKPVSAEELSEMVAQWTGPEAKERLAS